MNREIKFRVWGFKENKFVKHINNVFRDCYIYIGLLGDISAFDYQGDSIDLDENKYTVQQFTGFLDKNGKEIFEGDIVRICTNDDPEDLQWELIPITFEWGSFWVGRDVMALFVSAQEEAAWEQLVNLEAVGNIFENPELLNSQHAQP